MKAYELKTRFGTVNGVALAGMSVIAVVLVCLLFLGFCDLNLFFLIHLHFSSYFLRLFSLCFSV